MNFKILLAAAAGVAAAIATTGAAMADPNTASDQNLRYARGYVEHAYDMLSHDQAIYNGHRLAAMADINQARTDLTDALQFDSNPNDKVIPTAARPEDTVLVNWERGAVASTQNLEYTRTYVEHAIDMLQHDAADYGGYRLKAIAALQAARDQLTDAIQYRDSHPAADTNTASDQNLRYARAYIQHAYDMLSHDQAIYNGHRLAAIADLSQARTDLTDALQFDSNPNDKVIPTAARPADTDLVNWERGAVASTQNLEYTRTYIERAIDMLQHDAADYGGYRLKAIAALQAARDQLTDAIQYRNSHPTGESASTASDENIRYSRLYVDRAVDMLQHDQHDYAGHRAAAVTDLTSAQADLTAALRYDTNKEDSIAPTHAMIGDQDLDSYYLRRQFASNANIVYVRRYVERAIDMLSNDQHDYNGYRVKAIADLQAARQQLLLAIQSR